MVYLASSPGKTANFLKIRDRVEIHFSRPSVYNVKDAPEMKFATRSWMEYVKILYFRNIIQTCLSHKIHFMLQIYT